MRLVGAAVQTPLGDLAATIAAIAEGRRAEGRDPATGLVVARLGGALAADRNARLGGALAGDRNARLGGALAGDRNARLGGALAGDRNARLVGALAVQALEVARRAAREVPRGSRTGVFAATGGLRAQWEQLAPAMAEQVADGEGAWRRGLSRLHPLWMLRYLSNAAHAIIAAELGAVGDGATFAGPAAAASALVAAAAAFDAGTIDHAIVVALDDAAADEVAVELHARHPGRTPGSGVAALVLVREGGDRSAEDRTACVHVDAADGVDPDHAEPSLAAVAAVRSQLPPAERDVTFSLTTGWLGAAGPIVDAIVAAEMMRTGWPKRLDLGTPQSVTITAAESPGQIGIVRIEVKP